MFYKYVSIDYSLTEQNKTPKVLDYLQGQIVYSCQKYTINKYERKRNNFNKNKKNEKNTILVCGDIHGRKFWKNHAKI